MEISERERERWVRKSRVHISFQKLKIYAIQSMVKHVQRPVSPA